MKTKGIERVLKNYNLLARRNSWLTADNKIYWTKQRKMGLCSSLLSADGEEKKSDLREGKIMSDEESAHLDRFYTIHWLV